MPANPKYLTSNRTQRFAKVSAAILGGFMVSAATMLVIAAWSPDPKLVFLTYSFLMFIQWCALMLLPFLFENGWNCWKIYGAIIVLLIIFYFVGINFRS